MNSSFGTQGNIHYKRKEQQVEAIPFTGKPIEGLTEVFNAIDDPQIPFGTTVVGRMPVTKGDLILKDSKTGEIIGVTTAELLEADYVNIDTLKVVSINSEEAQAEIKAKPNKPEATKPADKK